MTDHTYTADDLTMSTLLGTVRSVQLGFNDFRDGRADCELTVHINRRGPSVFFVIAASVEVGEVRAYMAATPRLDAGWFTHRLASGLLVGSSPRLNADMCAKVVRHLLFGGVTGVDVLVHVVLMAMGETLRGQATKALVEA